jgi:hypothetical protein
MLNVKAGPIVASLLLSIGCTAESPRPPLPAPSPAPVGSNPLPASLIPSVVASSTSAAVASSTPTAGASRTAEAAVASSTPAEIAPPNDWRAYYDSTERVALRTAGGRVSRAGSELRIQLLDGRTDVFKDDTTPGLKFNVPRYAGYLKTIRSHSIHIIQYEGSGAYLVVDDSTGDSTIVFGAPVASPDGKRFVLTSMAGAGAGYDASMIEVWRMVGRKPEKEFHYDTRDGPWEASDAVWRDSVTIDFLKNRFVSFTEPYAQTPGRLKRMGTTWVLADSLPPRE